LRTANVNLQGEKEIIGGQSKTLNITVTRKGGEGLQKAKK